MASSSALLALATNGGPPRRLGGGTVANPHPVQVPVAQGVPVAFPDRGSYPAGFRPVSPRSRRLPPSPPSPPPSPTSEAPVTRLMLLAGQNGRMLEPTHQAAALGSEASDGMSPLAAPITIPTPASASA
ncbi:hypothetical protein NL676_025231 [Syzygium grande]|nr:hypothetical protein NL676_025231 [Syzygium grande]